MIHNTSYIDCPKEGGGDWAAENKSQHFDHPSQNMEQVQEDHSASTLSRNSLLYILALSLSGT